MAAPGMVAAVAGGGLESAVEIGFGERGDAVRHAQFLGGFVEGGQRLAHLRVEGIVRRQFGGVGVEAAERAEEYLPAHSQIGLHLDDFGHLLELRGQRGLGELGLQCGGLG